MQIAIITYVYIQYCQFIRPVIFYIVVIIWKFYKSYLKNVINNNCEEE